MSFVIIIWRYLVNLRNVEFGFGYEARNASIYRISFEIMSRYKILIFNLCMCYAINFLQKAVTVSD